MKILPCVDFYKNQINYYNKTVHNILTKEISLMPPNFPKNRKEKRNIITLLVTGFVGLMYEGISSYFHNKRQIALKKAFCVLGKSSYFIKKQNFSFRQFNGNVQHL